MSVVAVGEGAIVGKFDDFQFNLETGAIYGFRLKGPGMFGKSGGVASSAIVLLGRDLVLIRDEAAIEWGGSRNAHEGRAWASEYRGTRVMSRRGDALGTVDDYQIDAAPARIVAIVLDGERVVPLSPRVSLGRDAVIVEDATVVPAKATASARS
jgi:sporulation protein YlmC with PRC-barrel domain